MTDPDANKRIVRHAFAALASDEGSSLDVLGHDVVWTIRRHGLRDTDAPRGRRHLRGRRHGGGLPRWGSRPKGRSDLPSYNVAIDGRELPRRQDA